MLCSELSTVEKNRFLAYNLDRTPLHVLPIVISALVAVFCADNNISRKRTWSGNFRLVAHVFC